MDIESFLNRTNRSKADLLRELGRDPKSSLINSYIKSRSNPSFEIAVKLLLLGMSPLELFGPEIDEILRKHYSAQDLLPKNFNDPGFMKGLDSAADPESTLNKLMERKVLEMKAKGLI